MRSMERQGGGARKNGMGGGTGGKGDHQGRTSKWNRADPGEHGEHKGKGGGERPEGAGPVPVPSVHGATPFKYSSRANGAAAAFRSLPKRSMQARLI